MTEIIKLITERDYKFRLYAYRFTRDRNEVDEVIQELMLYYLTMNKETLAKIFEKDGINGVVGYGCIVIKRSLQSKKSQYYYKINKYYEKISSFEASTSVKDRESIRQYLEQMPEVFEDENKKHLQLEAIDCELDKMYWYDADIFKLYYYKGNTLDSLASKTKISRNSLFTTIKKVREKLKAAMKNAK
jgi:DNA-directed RNA polymerase specialized sigma24 family protein